MARPGLRTAAVAAIGIGMFSAPALAGSVEDTMELYLDDLTEAYEETLEYLSVYNTDDGEAAIVLLREHIEEISAKTAEIEAKAKTLDEDLGGNWSGAQRALAALDDAAEKVHGQVGVGEITLDPLKSAYDAALAELGNANAATKDFGKAYFALMASHVENAKALYDGAVKSGYESTMSYLKAKNFKEGKPAAENLLTVANRLAELSQEVDKQSEGLSEELHKLWNGEIETYYDINSLAIEAGVLTTRIGKGELGLDRLEEAYNVAGYSLNKSYTEMKAYGERLSQLCDTCR